MPMIRIGDHFVDSDTGQTWVRAGTWLVNPQTGKAVPLPADLVADTPTEAPPLAPPPILTAGASKSTGATASTVPMEFTWKGSKRRIPCGSSDPMLAGSPCQALTRFLADELVRLCEMPTVPPNGYVEASRAAGVPTEKVFEPLGQIQRWCQRNGIFDLSAIVVGKSTRTPGSGHYVSDTRDEQEWRDYVMQATRTLKDAR